MSFQAATHFEFNDIGHYGIGHGYILARPQVVEPPAECWPDIKILNALGRALTPGEYWPENWQDLLEAVLKPSGMTYARFCECGYLKGADRFRKYLQSGFPTPTGKVELVLSQAAKYDLPPLPRYIALPEETDPEYPLVLTSSKDPLYLHSSYRWVEELRQKRPLPLAEIHPRTAATFAIGDGDEVVIETKSGEITQIARLTDSVHPQVVNAAYGWWFPEGEAATQYEWQRANFNILTTTDKLGREFGTPNLKGIGCRIRRKSPLPSTQAELPVHP